MKSRGAERGVALRVFQIVVSAMDVERKNSIFGLIKSNRRNRMLSRTGERATRFFCNRRLKDKLDDNTWQEKYGVWTSDSGSDCVPEVADHLSHSE